MSMYSDYIAEYTDGHVLETEQGFAEYIFKDENTCYIKEIYVRPDFRKQGVGRDIAEQIVKIAKDYGCSTLLGSIVPQTKSASLNMQLYLAYGFKIDSSTNNFILLRKDI